MALRPFDEGLCFYFTAQTRAGNDSGLSPDEVIQVGVDCKTELSYSSYEARLNFGLQSESYIHKTAPLLLLFQLSEVGSALSVNQCRKNYGGAPERQRGDEDVSCRGVVCLDGFDWKAIAGGVDCSG